VILSGTIYAPKSFVKITGIAFGWMGSTTAFGAVVRKPYTSEVRGSA